MEMKILVKYMSHIQHPYRLNHLLQHKVVGRLSHSQSHVELMQTIHIIFKKQKDRSTHAATK